MNAYSPVKFNQRGFTLVELLVVIAIIGILAGIVVPQVPRYIMKAKYADAVTTLSGIDTSLVGILSDTSRSSFKEFLIPAGETDNNTDPDLCNFYYHIGQYACDRDPLYTDGLESVVRNYRQISDFYNTMFYEMIRLGRDSEFVIGVIRPDIYQKLGTSYMDLGDDPWDTNYNFWMGPLRRGPMLLRSYRVNLDQNPDNDEGFVPYQWDGGNYSQVNSEIPGQPKADTDTIRAALLPFANDPFAAGDGQIHGFGYPAPREIPSSVYVWSKGPNLQNDAFLTQQFEDGQDRVFFGGGDDPNNWDKNKRGWDSAPK
jgi:prepilin-type N-terminal cleavage/methylation domain-containing protein